MIIDHVAQRHTPEKPPRIYCRTKGCYQHTKGGKKHCSKHVLQTEYAQKIIAYLKKHKNTPVHEL